MLTKVNSWMSLCCWCCSLCSAKVIGQVYVLIDLCLKGVLSLIRWCLWIPSHLQLCLFYISYNICEVLFGYCAAHCVRLHSDLFPFLPLMQDIGATKMTGKACSSMRLLPSNFFPVWRRCKIGNVVKTLSILKLWILHMYKGRRPIYYMDNQLSCLGSVKLTILTKVKYYSCQ
jgi:hypothetical protein